MLSIPRNPESSRIEFLDGRPSPLETMVGEDEWNSVVRRINGIITKHHRTSVWSVLRSLLVVPLALSTKTSREMDREIDRVLEPKNMIFEKRGFVIQHPAHTQYQELRVFVRRPAAAGP